MFGPNKLCASMRHCVCSKYAAVSIIILFSLPSLRGQVFLPSNYNSTTSKTFGIQEAIDAASAAGGGTVEIGPGTFAFNPRRGRSALLIRSHVHIVGSGIDTTSLKLSSGSGSPASLIANANYLNPDFTVPDHDMTIEGLTLDGNAEGQVLADTVLTSKLAGHGMEMAYLESVVAIQPFSILCVDPGPNQEIVAPIQITKYGFESYFFQPHPAGAKVFVLEHQVMGVALIGSEDVTLTNLRIQNTSMDGIIISNTISPLHLNRTYTQRILIQNSEFLRCHRNGISVVDGNNITIQANKFQFISGNPGDAIDVEPDHTQEHGSNITISGNVIEDCFAGIQLCLVLNGPSPENAWGEVVVGNTIRRTKVASGILLYDNPAAPTLESNVISACAGGGILIIGAVGARIIQNVIYTLDSCKWGIWFDDQTIPSLDIYFSCNTIYLLDLSSGASSLCSSGPSCGI